MRKYKIYQNQELYLPTSGSKLSSSQLKQQYPILARPNAVFMEVDETLIEVAVLGILRQNYKIEDELTNEEALEKINEIINRPPEPSQEEIIQNQTQADLAYLIMLVE